MDRAYETVGSTDMKHVSGGSRILFEAIHVVWSAASKVLTGQTCHELLETFGSIYCKVMGHNVKSLFLHVHLILSSDSLLHLKAPPILF